MAQTLSADRDRAPGPSPARRWLALGLGLFVAALWVLLIPALAPDLLAGLGDVAAYTLLTLGIYAPLCVIALAAGRLGGARVLRAGANPRGWTGAGLLIGAGGLAGSAMMSWLNGGMVQLPGAMAAGVALFLGGIGLTVIQSAAEELLFRGWFQQALARETGATVAVLASAALFTAFHLFGGARAPLSVLTILLAGVVFGLLALRSGGVLAPIAAHAAWNATEDSLLGLVPNPGRGVMGSLLDLDLTGAALWGGSEEGLNASIGSVMILLAIMLPLLVPRTEPPARAPAPVG